MAYTSKDGNREYLLVIVPASECSTVGFIVVLF